MVLVLGIITLVASAAVGGIYLLTKEPIAVAQEKKVNDAIAQVMPQFDNAPATEAFMAATDIEGDSVKVYPAMLAGKAVGYAIETFSKNGFGGMISLMVGFLPDGTIKDISVISQNETPGLGDKIQKSKSDFAVQFEGKNPGSFKLAVRKDGGDVDAITASTISSRAFADAVARAYRVFAGVVGAELTDPIYTDGASGATAKASTTDKKQDGNSGATVAAETNTASDSEKYEGREPRKERERKNRK